ncbi:MAG TPA: hypothetical protein VF024_04590 [Solirubrobacteraceae bacterium]
MAETKKRTTGWFARWRERRREAALRAGEIQARSRTARRGNFGAGKGGGLGSGDGPVGPSGGI